MLNVDSGGIGGSSQFGGVGLKRRSPSPARAAGWSPAAMVRCVNRGRGRDVRIRTNLRRLKDPQPRHIYQKTGPPNWSGRIRRLPTAWLRVSCQRSVTSLLCRASTRFRAQDSETRSSRRQPVQLWPRKSRRARNLCAQSARNCQHPKYRNTGIITSTSTSNGYPFALTRPWWTPTSSIRPISGCCTLPDSGVGATS
jgi:hypothetical protein